DYAAVGPEHAYLHDNGRAEYLCASDDEALEGLKLCAEREGIIPALESAHAILPALNLAKPLTGNDSIIVNLSGRGDKDVELISSAERHHLAAGSRTHKFRASTWVESKRNSRT